MWKVLAQVNGVRTVAEIARRANLSEAELVEAFPKLEAAGLVEVCEHPEVSAAPSVAAETLEQVQAALARFIGPLASVLVEEAMDGLGEDPRAFPRQQLPALIEALSDQISDEAKRVGFQQAMLELLKRV